MQTNDLAELNTILSRWLRRLRFQRAVTAGVRGLAGGLALGLLLSSVALIRRLLLEGEWVALLAACAGAGGLLTALAAALWPAPRLRAARFFDRRFRLQERVSTALELAELDLSPQPPFPEKEGGNAAFPVDSPLQSGIGDRGDRSAFFSLRKLQLADALAHARQVDPRLVLSLRLTRFDLLLPALLLVAAVLVGALSRPAFLATQEQRMEKAVIAAEAERIEDLVERLQSDEGLSVEQKVALSQPLNEALQGLQATGSLEGAVSALNAAEARLQALEQSGQATALGLQASGQALGEGGPLERFSRELAAGNLSAASQALEELDISSSSEVAMQKLASQLEEAAVALAGADPALAEDLRAAAGALERGDSTGARENFDQAARALAETAAQVAGARQAGQAASELAQAQGRLTRSQALAEEGEAAAGSGAAPVAAPGEAGAEDSGQGTGGGAGRGEGDGDSGAGAPAGTDPIAQGNGPGDGGERPYEAIYAPQRLGGADGPDVALPGSGEQGDGLQGSTPSRPGGPEQSSVPYVEVFPVYAEAYRQAIESGRVPPHLRDLVREYFSSLEP